MRGTLEHASHDRVTAELTAERGRAAVALTLLLLASCGRPSPLTPGHEDLLCHRAGSALPPELYGEAAMAGSEPPAGAVQLESRTGKALLAIDLRQPRHRLRVPAVCLNELNEGEFPYATVRICVDAAGTVVHTAIITPSLPVIDEQLPRVLASWRYRPYLVDGHPTAFCYDEYFRVPRPRED